MNALKEALDARWNVWTMDTHWRRGKMRVGGWVRKDKRPLYHFEPGHRCRVARYARGPNGEFLVEMDAHVYTTYVWVSPDDVSTENP